ncbi:MAG: hypothetical protein R3C49_25775 [Planctomycetaceae bacterium]
MTSWSLIFPGGPKKGTLLRFVNPVTVQVRLDGSGGEAVVPVQMLKAP